MLIVTLLVVQDLAVTANSKKNWNEKIVITYNYINELIIHFNYVG